MKKYILIIVSFLFSSTLLADGMYVGAGVGISDHNVKRTAGFSWTDEKDRDISKKLFAGKMINQNVGIEVGLFDLGETSALLAPDYREYNALKGAYASAILVKEFSNVDAFAKLGIARLVHNGYSTDPTTPAAVFDTSKARHNTYFALGLDKALSKNNLKLRFEFEDFGSAGGNTLTAEGMPVDPQSLSLSLIKTF